MKPRISMITFGVRELAAAIEFYENGLGFPRMDSPPEVAFFTLNGTWLGLYGRAALAQDAQVPVEGNGFELAAAWLGVGTGRGKLFPLEK
jgi:catechol 2,3-dioxygenase-like lactoylglutathione lyase family enzyme